MNVRWHRGAQQDLLDAAEWYDNQQSGIGGNFIRAVEDSIDRIVQVPDTFAFTRGDVRSCPVKQFPYSVHYRLEGDSVRILVIKHDRRRADYGANRR